MSERLITAFPPWSPDEITYHAIREFNSPTVGEESPWADIVPVIRAKRSYR